jgi:hypothetical protein
MHNEDEGHTSTKKLAASVSRTKIFFARQESNSHFIALSSAEKITATERVQSMCVSVEAGDSPA